jgi:hypothetical protein
MSYLGLLIAGFVGMLVFWLLALLLWRTTAARGEAPAAPPPAPRTNAIPMQFRRLQSGAMSLLDRQRPAHVLVEHRTRRNCMIVDTVEEADSPRPRDAHAGQDLATQPYKRARHRMPRAAGESND